MYNSHNENQLIVHDIVDVLQDFTSIQIDIDETRIKAAALLAQNLDIKRVIGKDNIERCINPETEADENLKTLIIPALCYHTYARCLRLFHGSLTDSGYVVEGAATDRDTAKAVSNEMAAAGDSYLEEVKIFLQSETVNVEEFPKSRVIRAFGGRENR